MKYTRRNIYLMVLVLVLALAMANPTPVAHAATIIVDTTTDDNTPNGNCTLREAIIAANTDTAVDNCPAGSGADTIILSTETYTLTISGAGEDAAATGDLDIDGDLTITGVDQATTIIDGASIDRVFEVRYGSTVDISGVTVRNGSVSSINYGLGGGIANRGTLTLTDSTISDNTAESQGGGISNHADTTLALIDSTLSGNTAQRYFGGGIWTHPRSTVTIVNSTISGNSANAGGGIAIGEFGTATIANSTTISGNSAYGDGGGIFSDNDTALTIVNSTISNNSASSDAGGIFNYDWGAVTILNSSISGNSASGDGGGIFSQRPDPVTVVNSTIIAGNTGSTGPDCVGAIGSSGYNLVGNTSDCTFTPTSDDLINIDPLLGPLQDNGGPTETHALLPGSPAIDAGDDSACPATDQRGEPRPADGDGDGTATCDIGAYEASTIVPFDIRPSVCPNPLNVKSKGVLPVAILGTASLDVTQVDPASVELEGVFPLRWAIKDVATPYEPFVGKEDAYDCTKEGPDGYMDLTLKFDIQEIVAALGPVNDEDVLVLSLTGRLRGGEGFAGEDVVWIIKKVE